MAATASQQRLLNLLDLDAYLLRIEHDVRDVATRLANRGRTPDEGDDVKTLMAVRGRVEALRLEFIREHPDARR